ncbi:MAG: CGLD27 family protein, partial [Cyanobacteria bacterium J06638_20]
KQETIFYEESGWYDGQTWTKPEEVLQRDRLIVTYQIQPILQRLLRTYGVFGGLILSSVLFWQLL